MSTFERPRNMPFASPVGPYMAYPKLLVQLYAGFGESQTKNQKNSECSQLGLDKGFMVK
jgi:hypothetical protein